MKKLISVSLVTFLFSTILLSQSTGTPRQLQVKVDSNGYLLVSSAAQTPPYTTTVFTNARLSTDANGALLIAGAGGSSGTCGSNTDVCFNNGGVIDGEAGLTYNNTLNALSISDTLAVGPGTDPTDLTSFGNVQLISGRFISGDPGYTVGQYTEADLSTSGTNPNTYINPIIREATSTIGHTTKGIIGHDTDTRIAMANSVTLAESYPIEDDVFVTGSGNITFIWHYSGADVLKGAAIGDLYKYYLIKPAISAGATLVNYYGIGGDDISTLTVSGVKHFINYQNKFIVDSAGIITTTGLNEPTVRANRSATQSINNTTITYIQFNAADSYDTDTMHDTTTNNTRITFNKAGVYQIFAEGQYDVNIAGDRYLFFDLNGVGTRVATGYLPSPGIVIQCSGQYKFAAGDYIEVGAFQSSGGALNISNVVGAATRIAVG